MARTKAIAAALALKEIENELSSSSFKTQYSILNIGWNLDFKKFKQRVEAAAEPEK